MRVGLFLVSHAKDLPFFGPFARSYAKFASGFYRAVVMVPNEDAAAFAEIATPCGLEVQGYPDLKERSFLYHMVMKCRADQILTDCEFIFHIDSDCVFAEPSRPENWFASSGKPILLYRKFSDLLEGPLKPDEERSFMGCTASALEMNRGQYQWKFAADFALGFPVKLETMQWMPITHHRKIYGAMREHIERRFSQPFETYVLGCRNEFPQTFCEFNTLGGIANEFFPTDYAWTLLHNNEFPNYKVIQSWSRGGLDLPHDYPIQSGGRQTPAQLFQRLGVL